MRMSARQASGLAHETERGEVARVVEGTALEKRQG